MTDLPAIRVRGAREHNLRRINVDVPRNKLTVITGLSGSGKSSLAFDTIYAEGHRRYVESLSAYARQFLELMQKPEVDAIEGLSPAIAIEQKTTSRNPRSTVGTVTEIYDYMRLLWARIGIPHSPATGLPIVSQTVSQMVEKVQSLEKKTRFLVLAPIVRGKKGEHRARLTELQARGFARVRVNGTVYPLDDIPPIEKKKKNDIEVVVDRLVMKEDKEEVAARLAPALETALELGEGIAYILELDSERLTVLSSNFACPVSGFTLEEVEPRLFSFNNPSGACPKCDGLGEELFFDPDLIVPDPALSLADGALAPWSSYQGLLSPIHRQTLRSAGSHFGFSLNTPWRDLPEATKEILLHGSPEKIQFVYNEGTGRIYRVTRPFEGVIPNIVRRYRDTESSWSRDELSKYKSNKPCGSCQAYRLKPEALCVLIQERHIGHIADLSIREARQWFTDLSQKLVGRDQHIAERILREINERLGFLMAVGLDYLTLSRKSGSLSGGESQRIRLASQIGSGLTGVLYVLDEPSIGLHQRDNGRLLATLRRLRDLGNTVIVVEHDEEAIRSADFIIDMGFGAGRHGGSVVASGELETILAAPDSLTGAYLSGRKVIPVPAKRRPGRKGQTLEIQGVCQNNLKSVSVAIPLGTLTCVTGVSGSGKSSLVIETLEPLLAQKLMGSRRAPGPYRSVSGLGFLDKVIVIDQSPIGRTPRSNPATYTGTFTPIRTWFANLPEARTRGYSAGRFSFNVKGGRCEACQGDGLVKIEMHFLPDVYVHCDVCRGRRYNRETLEIRFRDKSIADILRMTVEEGRDFFKAVPSIYEKLTTLDRVGLGYIQIGQQATTLSGGEAQRVKLAKELSRRSTGQTIYILDEPTTGLHFEDVARLLEVLNELVDQGNTVVVIEHNLEIIKQSDWIIDIGPEGGDLGGEVLASGTPEQVAEVPQSVTGHYLKPLLSYTRAAS